MASSKNMVESNAMPEGYRAIAIRAADEASPLRLCVLARTETDAGASPLVLLRNLTDASVYLGCLVDAGGRVRDWMEVWVQNLDGLGESYPAYREQMSNHALDEQWAMRAKTFREMDPEGFLQAGWESAHPLPTFLDLEKAAPVHPADEAAGGRWELCRDDAMLKAAGLPPYSTSLFRYLHQPALAERSRFVPVVAGAPESAATVSLEEMLGKRRLVAFNAQGGLMMACRFCPLGFEEYVDLLGGKSWGGIEHGKKKINFGGCYRSLEDWKTIRESGAHLFLGRQGRAGRFMEVFHLKLQLLLEAFRAVRAFTESEQLPFLNLSTDSFRVRLGQVGAGLPFLWTARCGLVKPVESCALPVKMSQANYYVRGGRAGTSVFVPEGVGLPVQGSGSVRIRKVLPPEGDGLVLEATLVTQERLVVSPHDLIWIQLPLPSGRVDLYGHLYSAEGLAYGEARFRTVPLKLPATVDAALRGSEGVAFARSPFEIIPLLSTPCDLYAMGVLAVRTLLVNDQTTLALALDETLSMARQLGVEGGATQDLGQRIQTLMEKDARWRLSLGPHRLTSDPMEPNEALKLAPAELWRDTLAAVVRLFPGVGPDSFCRDYGDVPSLALETTFDPAIAALENLVRRTRSLIVIDWTLNREISAVIKGFQQKL
jgi:hypothetical protein